MEVVIIGINVIGTVRWKIRSFIDSDSSKCFRGFGFVNHCDVKN